MLSPAKRAEASTSTLADAARQGGSNINPRSMEVTMDNITARPGRATLARYAAIELAGGRLARPDVLVWMKVAERPWGRAGATPHQLWNTFLGDGSPLVHRHREPERESCRELVARGVSGLVAFIHENGMVGMVMDIERAAQLTVVENDDGIRLRKYVPFDRSRVTKASPELPVAAEAGNGLPDAKRAALCDDAPEGRAQS